MPNGRLPSDTNEITNIMLDKWFINYWELGTITDKVIDGKNEKVQNVTLYVGTATTVKNVFPLIQHTGKAINPPSGQIQDFSSSKPVLYAVTAENGDNRYYSLTVNNSQDFSIISFNRNGGTGGRTSTLCISGNSLRDIAEEDLPTRVGYKFMGYNSQANGSGTDYYDGTGKATGTSWNSAHTLMYARWKEYNCTIKFVNTGGTGGQLTTLEAKYGLPMPALTSSPKVPTTPTSDKNAFCGYFDASGKQYYNEDGTPTRNWDQAVDGGTVTLTARIEPYSTANYPFVTKFYIKNAAHLKQVADISNASSASYSFSGKTVRLEEVLPDELNMTIASTEYKANSFQGLSFSTAFAGTFDGNSKRVRVAISRSGSSDVGFFGRLTGTVKNLTVNGTVSGTTNVGGICGYVPGAGATLTSCTNNAVVTGTGDKTGGLIGYVYYQATMTNCNNTGTGTVSGTSSVGGFVGYASDKLTVTSGSNSATITGSDKYVGGIVGYIDDRYEVTIDGITNSGVVTSTKAGDMYVGGFVGRAGDTTTSGATKTITIKNCTNSAGIGNSSRTNNYVGGIVGYAGSKTQITGCTSNTTTSIIEGNTYVGGIAGRSYGPIIRGRNDSPVRGTTNVGGFAGQLYGTEITDGSNNGSVSGVSFVGGFAGQLSGTQITDGSNNGSVSGVSYVGGICGYVNEAGVTLTNCTNNAAVSGSSSYIGGLIGTVRNTTTTTMTNCNNKGTVSGTDTVGGFVGYADGKLTVTGGSNTKAISGSSVYIGGIVGFIIDSYEVKIENVTNRGAVTSDLSENANVGGIVGVAGNSSTSGATKTVTIKNCTNEAVIGKSINVSVGGIVGSAGSKTQITGCTNALAGIIRGNTHVGGIAGKSNGPITNCTNNAAVTGSDKYVGGIVGYISDSFDVTIDGVTNSGAVTSTKTGDMYVGGIVGQAGITTTSGAAKTVTIKNCTNSAGIGNSSKTNNYAGGIVGYAGSKTQITNNCGNTGTITGGKYVGGIAGKSYGPITSGYNTGSVSGSISDGAYVGGIVGEIERATISLTYNAGAVNASGEFVGGIAGTMRAGVTIERCYNKGSVTTDTNYAGGITGDIYGSGHRIDSSYNIGTIEAKKTGAGYNGGLIGRVDVSTSVEIQNCYSIGNITGPSAGSTKGGLIGITASGSSSVTVKGLVFAFDNLGGTVGSWQGGGYQDIPGTSRKTAAVINGMTQSSYSGVSGGFTFTGTDYWEFKDKDMDSGLTLINGVRRRPVLKLVGGALSNK